MMIVHGRLMIVQRRPDGSGEVRRYKFVYYFSDDHPGDSSRHQGSHRPGDHSPHT